MRYQLANLPIQSLFEPVSAAIAAMTRLDERIAQSELRDGWVSRCHFADACASLWVDGELVHLEDLVLHDATMGVRAPSHEVTIASDILRTRRRIASHEAAWAISPEGLRNLRRQAGDMGIEEFGVAPELKSISFGTTTGTLDSEDDEGTVADDLFARQLAEMDRVLARSSALLSGASADPSLRAGRGGDVRDPLLYEDDWDEDERLAEWQTVVAETEGLPGVLRAALCLDAWEELRVLQHAPWLGRLLASSLLRQNGLTTVHLAAFSVGLKQIGRERRTSRKRDVRLLAFVEALRLTAETGLKEHDRLVLANRQLQLRLEGRRSSSKLPQLVELVLARPMVSSGMIAEELGVTAQGALKIAAELHLRELTGRGRFRAWGIV
jgi:hypothetical protein